MTNDCMSVPRGWRWRLRGELGVDVMPFWSIIYLRASARTGEEAWLQLFHASILNQKACTGHSVG